MSVLDELTIDITCENCGRKTPQSIAWLKTDTHFVCACGTTIQIDASDALREIGKAEQSLADLQRSFESLGKRK